MTQNLTPTEARQIAEEAYIYGFAIVENYKAIFGMCVYQDSPQYAGFNHYLHGRKLFDPDYKVVVSANNDTLYSTTFADLRTEPIVVSVPPTGERYFVIQLVDMVTDNFAYIGTRATGSDGGDFVLVGPSYKGAIPADKFKQVIVCPSQFVALATRTAINGPEDLAGVVEIQDKLAVTPLSTFLKTPAPDPAPAIQFPPYTPALYASPKLLEYLNLFLQWHTPRFSEAELMKRFVRIKVGPNLEFNYDGFTSELQEAISQGVAAGHQQIEKRGDKLGETTEGWDYTPPMGNYSYNDDGSLTLYIQHQSPGTDKEANWLPAPEESFYLIARAYIPKEPMLNGAYRLPAVKQA